MRLRRLKRRSLAGDRARPGPGGRQRRFRLQSRTRHTTSPVTEAGRSAPLTAPIIGGTARALIKITFDKAKRAAVLETRGIDMGDAAKVFVGECVTRFDERFDYAEPRYQTVGRLAGRFVLIAWTPDGETRRVITMRYCHAKEVRKIRRLFPLAFGDAAG